jgi:ribonuclease-3
MNFNDLEKILGVHIKNKSLYEEAFTHKSYVNENREAVDNERLEFLGDAVLELIVTEHLFQTFPSEPEGKMTKLRSILVSGKSLSQISKLLGINVFLKLSRGEEHSGGREKNPILANLFEAVLGAIFLDSGYLAVKEFIFTHLIPRLSDDVQRSVDFDPKSALQELAQEKWGITPLYRVLSESGPDHQKKFFVGVFIDEENRGEGEGTSKRKAEIAAAQNALKRISS